MQRSPGFAWNIDELAHIKPARIEESPVQQVSPDLELETRAQAAIDRFFKQNQIIPSPWNVRQKGSKSLVPLDTPNRLLNNVTFSQELSKLTKDGKTIERLIISQINKNILRLVDFIAIVFLAWSQTVLSLPLNLPPNVEEVLKPFFTFTQVGLSR